MAVLTMFEVLYVCQKVCFRTPVVPVVLRKGVECLIGSPGDLTGKPNMWFVVFLPAAFGFIPQVLEALKVEGDVLFIRKFRDVLVQAPLEGISVDAEPIVFDHHPRVFLHQLVEADEGPPKLPTVPVHLLKVLPGCCSRLGVPIFRLVPQELLLGICDLVHDAFDFVS